MLNHALMQKQREARLARDAQRSQRINDLRTQRTVVPLLPIGRQNAERFWDNIDTSGGPDACHPWTGVAHYNHDLESGWERFLQGHFHHQAITTRISTRVLIFMTYGKELPRTLDVSPLCGEHLCHNLRHLVITKHGGGNIEKKLSEGVPVGEFFCAAIPA